MILVFVSLWIEYGIVCNNHVVDQLRKYSNLFDGNTTRETFGMLDIGYPFGVHGGNIQESVDYVFENRESARECTEICADVEKLPPCTSERTACFNQDARLCDPVGWDCGNTDGIFEEIIENEN